MPRNRRVTALLALVLVTCTLLRSAVFGKQKAAETPACPSFSELGRQIDKRVQAIKPGRSLREFTSEFATQALNFWDRIGSQRETVFFVTVEEGNAQVTDELVCRFDKNDLLLWCKRECCRGHVRTITLEQYNALTIGESRAAVERRLCSPSDVAVDPKDSTRVSTYYHIDLPVGHHDEGQTVMLVFKSAALSSKGMSPYY
jgi:hypothetical protein